MSRSISGSRHISLFVPELLSGLDFLKELPKHEVPKLPALQLLLSRSIQKKNGYEDFYTGVCSLSGIEVSRKQDIPVAAITVAAENKLHQRNNSDYFIFSEPVVMKPDRDSVVLLESLLPDSTTNSLSFDESEQLIAEINQHFIGEPWTLNATKKGDWYFILSSKSSITTTNIFNVILENAQPHLPKGDDAQYWRKIINEVEMLLFASKVNEERLAENKQAVTSLWLWGGGVIPKFINSNDEKDYVDTLWGENKFLQSVAQFMELPYKSLMTNEVRKLLQLKEFNRIVIVNTELKSCWQQRNHFSWLDTLKKLELNLFEPILTGLRKGDIDVITMYQNRETNFNISRRSVKAWWKPVKKLDALSSLI